MADGHDASPVDGGDVASDVSPGPNGQPREPDAQAAGEPAEPSAVCYYGSLGEFAGWLLRCTAARPAGRRACSARSGGSTRRRWRGWTRCGAPSSSCARTRGPA